ncbi:MAG: YggS family pyridoxal phosphate-dependent enzyme [Actinomycetota bacterium]
MTDTPLIDRAVTAALVEPLRARLEALHERLRVAGGHEVELLAVSKAQPVEAAVAAAQVGLTSLGENYAQELASKAEAIAADNHRIDWHFVGQLQRNKVRLIAEHVAVWQSVDRLRVGEEIAKRAPGATVFAQVNLADDPGKAGCAFDEVDELVDQLRELGLRVEGLMGVGTAEDTTATSAGFDQLRAVVDRHGLNHCSMGMTDDLELAVAAGSTMVRIGTAVFGPRSRPT